MLTFEGWLDTSGPRVASQIDSFREIICDMVSSRLATAFPSLCYDATRFDAIAFQQQVFHNTPRRFHRLIQVVLRVQAVQVIEREYRWGCPVVARYGVARHHLLSHARWYFETTRATALFASDDLRFLDALEGRVTQMIDQITLVSTPMQRRTGGLPHNGHRNGNRAN